MKNAALVLSGGGSLGAAHVGVFSVLEKKYAFDFLVGVSAGAIVAAGIACGKTAVEIGEVVHKQSFFKLAFDFTPSNFGILRGEKILKILNEFYEEKNFEDLPKEKKLIIGTTDFQTGERVMISEGSIADAVRASISVPVLFEPYFHQERWLADGGLTMNFPLDTAINEYAGDTIIGVDVATALREDFDFKKKRFFGKFTQIQNMFERTIRIFLKNQQNFKKDKRVQIIAPALENHLPIQVNKLKEIDTIGVEAAKKFISQ